MSSDFRIIAIVAAYNESDVIGQVVRDLIDQGIQVYLLDDGSTDGTAAIVEPFLGRGVVGIERLRGGLGPAPDAFEWERILMRKAQLAADLDAQWFVHHDADEFRESPWRGMPLIEAIRRVDALGFNAIDFDSLDFWPTHDKLRPGDDVRDAFPFYSQAPYDRVQIRCWKKTGAVVDLASSGGHEAVFPGRKIFPMRFVLRHYPVRGQGHGERKVFRERRGRFLEQERRRGWHVQYDQVQEGGSFIRDPATLTRYDPDAVRIRLALRHRGVEALEASHCALQSLADSRARELEAITAQLADARGELQGSRQALAGAHREAGARAAEIAALREELQAVVTELGRSRAETATLRAALESSRAETAALHTAIEDGARRLADLHRSLSWRWTSPARTVLRMVRGR
jgi:hypothetical protein